ncbi:Regulatory protein Spx [Frankliniella fusca]|uniref:Regulatory protein Spx n=1 Tax=Frankliniella fusca TaxID=407009 RepID=A0AAE1LSP7_9NEOP|nr:Regulatory protein Spx [Frankliniella fusca]
MLSQLEKKGREASQIWSCSNKNCNGRIKVTNGVVVSQQPHIQQCTPRSERVLERNELRNVLKRKATEELSVRPLKLARQELMKGDYKEVCANDLSLVRRSVYREKHKVWPNIPKTNDEVQAFLQKAFEEKSIKTSTGELFLYLSEKGLPMFTCQSNLRLMAHCTSLMGDGTFDKATKHTYQLYTIHGYLDGFHIPLAFFPLKGESQELYTEVWNLILREADLIRSFVCPYAILFDFELGAHNAVRDPTYFGKNCNVKGCRFHFSQNLTKKIRGEPVLRTAYDKKQSGEMGDSNNEDDIPERKWLLRFLGLSCLPPNWVGETVQELEETRPEAQEYQVFLDYVKKTYSSPNSTFPPCVWASVPTMEPATTNGAEAFHCDFNSQFCAAHPNIFSSISILLEIQAQTYVKMNSIAAGERNYVEPKRLEIKQRRMRAWAEVVNGERSVMSYCLYMGSLNAAMQKKKRV